MWPNAIAPFEIVGLLGWFALGLPLFLLATLVGLAFKGRRRNGNSVAAQSRRELRECNKTTGVDASEQLGAFSRMKTSVQTRSDSALDHAHPIAALSRAGGTAVLAAMEGARDPSEAVEALGALVFQSASGGAVDVQAAARLQLGDLAEDAGDMTTACEHWQIARDLFDKSENIVAREIAEEKMLSNGCPTDWVLNEF